MLSPDMFRYVSGLSALVLGQSFCGIATLVAAFDPDAAVTLAESPLPPDCVDRPGRTTPAVTPGRQRRGHVVSFARGQSRLTKCHAASGRRCIYLN